MTGESVLLLDPLRGPILGSEAVALTMRVGYPDIAVGISFFL